MAETKSKFIKVRCTGCKNEQVIYSHASTKINCLVCEKELAKSTGGKTNLKNAKVLEVLEE